MQHKHEGLIRYGLIPLTILLAALYLSRGYRNALLLPEGSRDLGIRYREQQHIIKGVNPNYIYEVLRGYSGAKTLEEILGGSSGAKAIDIDSTNDLPPLEVGGGGYPPWAFFTALVLVPPINWPVTKLFFAILNAFSLGIMAWFTYRITRPYGRLPAFGLLTSVLAIGQNSYALGMGQYGLVVNAMIAGMALCLTAERPIGAGMLYGLSLVKPSISAPFFFVLIDRRWSAITAAMVYIATASLAIWAITGTDPMTMLIQILDGRRAGGLPGIGDRGPIAIALHLGISEPIAFRVAAITGLVVSFLVMWAFRQSHIIILLGTASVLGRLWMVHRPYDDVMMAFLLIAIGHLALRESRLSNDIVFALVAISLWLPPRVSDIPYIGYSQLLIWIFSLVYLLVRVRHEALRLSDSGLRGRGWAGSL